MTFRNYVIEVNPYRPHQWYTLNEVENAFNMYMAGKKIKGKKISKKYFKVVNPNEDLNGKTVWATSKPNKSNLLLVYYGTLKRNIHVKFLQPCISKDTISP